MREQIQSGNFRDMDELLGKALDALLEKEGDLNLAGSARSTALLALQQASPY